MGRKVFMSVLGTGIYSECVYRGKNCSTRTRFVQEATLKDIGAVSWGEDDVVSIIMTAKSRELNWSKGITRRTKQDGTVIPYSGLEAHLEKLSLPCTIKTLDIPDGKDEGEIWQIFDIIYNFLEEGDELYFDLTHAFRYQPMLLLVLGNYAKFLKNVKIVYMGYGNYEGREVNADGHPELDVAPIMDLLPLVLLEDWTFAAGAFQKTGRVEPIIDALTKSESHSSLPKKVSSRIDESVKNLVEFENAIRVCCSKSIINGGTATSASACINRIGLSGYLPKPLVNVMMAIRNDLCKYSKSSFENIVLSLMWCKRYGLVQQGYTLCQEGIVTKFSERYESMIDFERPKDLRKYWSSILAISETKAANTADWNKNLIDNYALTNFLLNNNFIKDVRSIYKGLTEQRNNVNHAGYSSDDVPKSIFAKFNDIIDNCIEKVFNVEFPELKFESANPDGKPAVFINYTNHPSSTWEEKQLRAAEEYGEVVDLPFRSVEEDFDEKRLAEIAEEETGKILELAAGKNATVHIMGEMTLTFAIVGKLKAAGVPCVASTTARQVVENADGTRTSTFNFVRFRAY